MRLKVFVLNAGSDVVFETLEAIKKYIKIPHDLLVWYHPLNITESINMDHFVRLKTYTNDIILCTKPKGCPSAFGFTQIYSSYDYLLQLDDDMVIKENAVETMLEFHTKMNRVAFVGEGEKSYLMPEYKKYEVNVFQNLPDWGGMLSRVVIDDIGAQAGFFPAYGFNHAEWMERAILKGYKVINFRGLITHGGLKNRCHESKNKMEGLTPSQEEGIAKLIIIEQMGFKHYNWWSSKI